MKSMLMSIGGPVMPRSKSRATVRSPVEPRVLEVAHARRADAGGGEPIVEPGREAAAEVGAQGLVQRAQDLQQHEDGTGDRERNRRGSSGARPRRRARPSRPRRAAAAARAARASTTRRAPARAPRAAAPRRTAIPVARASGAASLLLSGREAKSWHTRARGCHIEDVATGELFESEPRDLVLAPGAVVLGGFARAAESELVAAVREVTGQAPFRHMLTPGGKRMSAAMSNCGDLGWVTDRSGYRYASEDPRERAPLAAHAGRHLPSGGRSRRAGGLRRVRARRVPDQPLRARSAPHPPPGQGRARLRRRRSSRSRWACRPSSSSEAIAAPIGRRPCGWFTATSWCGADPRGCAITASGRSRTASTRCSAATAST